jgi:glutamate-1-semialdehyde 2,1-aminomutase
LAEIICNRYPAVDQVRFTNSGSEAVMQAVKAARAFTGRHAIAKIEGAYHGTYDYAEVSLKPNPAAWGPADRPVSQAYDVGTPASVADEVVVLPFNNTDAAVKIIKENRTRLSAVILDPLPTRVGLIRGESAYFSALQQACVDAGIVFILDEVISLRLDYAGAQKRYGLEPDLVCMAKIIGGGFPIGAVGGKSNVMAVFNHISGDPQVSHTGTFNANRVSMAAGCVSLELLTPDAVERINTLGEQLRSGFSKRFDEHSAAWQVTGDGSCFRLHPKREPIVDYRTSQLDPAQRAQIKSMYWGLINRGVMVAPGCYGYLSTATTPGDVATIVDAVADVVSEQKLRK